MSFFLTHSHLSLPPASTTPTTAHLAQLQSTQEIWCPLLVDYPEGPTANENTVLQLRVHAPSPYQSTSEDNALFDQANPFHRFIRTSGHLQWDLSQPQLLFLIAQPASRPLPHAYNKAARNATFPLNGRSLINGVCFYNDKTGVSLVLGKYGSVFFQVYLPRNSSQLYSCGFFWIFTIQDSTGGTCYSSGSTPGSPQPTTSDWGPHQLDSGICWATNIKQPTSRIPECFQGFPNIVGQLGSCPSQKRHVKCWYESSKEIQRLEY